MYIACQTRDGKLDELFCHENQQWTPALSHYRVSLYQGTESDLMAILEKASEETSSTRCHMHVNGMTKTLDE